MKKYLLYPLLLLNFYIHAQPSLQWQKSIGGHANDYLTTMIRASDGGYIVVGTSSSNDSDITGNHGSSDVVVIKLNDDGGIEWQKSYGGSNSDSAESIRKTTDGGYIIAGGTSSNDGDVSGNHGNGDYWIIKISANGILEWQKCLGGTNGDGASIALQTPDGGYIVGGSASSIDGDITGMHNDVGASGSQDYWVVKLDSTGNIVWQKCYGSNRSDALRSIALTADGGYILNGEIQQSSGNVTVHYGSFDYWVVKINSAGRIEWQKTLGGTSWDTGTGVIQNRDGDYIVCGYSSSNDMDISGNHGGGDAWVVKLGATGNIIWQKPLGGSTGSDYLYSIQQTIDGGYLLAGDTTSNDGDADEHHGTSDNFDYWVIKLSSSGDVEWHKSLGGTGQDTAVSLIESSNGNYIVCGYSSSNDGDVTGNHGSKDGWIASLSDNLTTTKNKKDKLLSFYPNPTKDAIHLNIDSSIIGSSYIIYDQLSRVVQTGTLKTLSPVIQMGNLSNGVYILNLYDSKIKIFKN